MAIANKMILAFVALTLLASTVEASLMLEKFEAFLDKMNLDNLIIWASYQVWGFLGPLVAGPLDVILYYLWSEAGYTQVLEGNVKVTLKFFELFGMAGMGSYDMLFDLIFDVAPKILVNQVVSTSAKLPYGQNFDNIQTTPKFSI